jgi:TonB family protein
VNTSTRSKALNILWRSLQVLTVLAVVLPQARLSHVYGDNEEHNIEKLAVKRVQPPYPPNAQKFKIEGIVTVQVTVGGDGKVTKAEFVRGHNVFRSVALDAAKKWEFKVAGEPSLEGTIRFAFKLND